MNSAYSKRLCAWSFNSVCALLLATGASAALAVDTPTSLAGATVVTAEQARKLQDGGAVMVDTRVANEFVQEHIKGARSIPYKEKSGKEAAFNAKDDSFDLAKLPGDKATAVIFYCNGAACWKSYKGSKLALDAGYKKVNWLRDGIPEWKAKGYPVE
jgi:rhodanese-related sulfurtransferase